MSSKSSNRRKVSIIVPCYNEEETLEVSVGHLLAIEDDVIELEVLIVNDASSDRSLEIAKELAQKHPQIVVLNHEKNQGKGAALNTGIQKASGEFVGIQDADLEYDPRDLRRLLEPLLSGEADVSLGSRFLSSGTHRVLYFWHSMGNKFLTFLSNMFTDLNLTDMETCYKLFRADLIKQITIKEKRFGVEPEMIAKIAHMRPRIYEMGISYHGRTYEEGKKIGVKDGFRALYCIFHYNAPKAPMPIQFLIYLLIGGVSAIFNLVLFLLLKNNGVTLTVSLLTAFFSAAFLNYFLCILFLFRHKAKWDPTREILIFLVLIIIVGIFDLYTTKALISVGISAVSSKLWATVFGLVLNFAGRKYIVFPEASSGPWKPQRK